MPDKTLELKWVAELLLELTARQIATQEALTDNPASIEVFNSSYSRIRKSLGDGAMAKRVGASVQTDEVILEALARDLQVRLKKSDNPKK